MRKRKLVAVASSAFTLIELLVVIAVIGIMSALVITSITNAARDSRFTMARQQQATLQSALHAWIAAQGSISKARTDYTSTNTAGKLLLLSNYLQAETFEDFSANSSGASVGSTVLDQIDHHLSFSTWTSTNQPVVQLSTNE